MEPKHKLSKRIHNSVLNIDRKYTENFNSHEGVGRNKGALEN